MGRNVVGIIGTAIVAIYAIGSGRMVATDAAWYRSLPRLAWQPPSFVFGIIWPYNFAMLVVATWLVASHLSTTNQMVWLISLALSVIVALSWARLFFQSHSCLQPYSRSHFSFSRFVHLQFLVLLFCLTNSG
jgi:tryptophan-rich sensory protein